MTPNSPVSRVLLDAAQFLSPKLPALLTADDPVDRRFGAAMAGLIAPWPRIIFKGGDWRDRDKVLSALGELLQVRGGDIAGGLSPFIAAIQAQLANLHLSVIDHEGRLVPGPGTRVIRTSEDAQKLGLGVLVLDQLVPEEICARMAEAYLANLDKLNKNADQHPFWINRLLNHEEVDNLDPAAAELMLQAMRIGTQAAERFHKPTSPLFPDLLQLVGWQAGLAMPPHIDNAHPDDTPHREAHRDFNALLYLNDDYEGGGLYLTGHDVVIQPRRGMFVSMPAGRQHEHAVLRVESGFRVTMPWFLTLTQAKAQAPLLKHLNPSMAGVLSVPRRNLSDLPPK